MSADKPETVQELYRQVQAGERTFVPHEHYDPEGDSVTYFHENVACNGDWLDPFVTLFYEPSSARLVGFRVKCVATIVKHITNERGGTDAPITFGDVLVKAGQLSQDARKQRHRERAQESELATIELPTESYSA